MDKLKQILAEATERTRVLDEMHAAYEEMDQAEYEAFNREIDERNNS